MITGWGRTSVKSSLTVKPVVFATPVIDFNWNPTTISNRKTEVTISGVFTDKNNTIIDCSWTIHDEYDKNNPDNPKYGEVVENNKKYPNVEKTYTPKHKFQSNKDHLIELHVRYDDGFCEKSIDKSKTLKTIDAVKITPSFIVMNDEKEISEMIPGVEISILNNTNYNNILSTDWTLNDRDYYSDEDKLIDLSGVKVAYKWKNATRLPICIKQDTSDQKRKSIKMVLTYDNGWVDNKTAELTKEYLAKTNELTNLDIQWSNIDVLNSLDVYGKERVEFTRTFDVLYDYLKVLTEWEVEDETVVDESFVHQFKSAGDKHIIVDVNFDDGYGNTCSVSAETDLVVKKLLEPDLDFLWEGETLAVGSNIKFRSISSNFDRPYGHFSELKIDYYNDGEFDLFDIDGDGIDESSSIDVNTPWWHIFDRAVKPTYIRLVGIWNDGFEDNEVEVVKSIELIALPPECHLTVNHIANRKYQLIIEPDSEDPDGLVYKFELYLKTPIVETEKCKDMNDLESDLPVCSLDTPFGTEYYLMYSSDWIDSFEHWVSVASSGKFKAIRLCEEWIWRVIRREVFWNRNIWF